jgi:hypothetical protein
MTSITLLAVIGMIMPAYAAGVLYVGSDTEEFAGAVSGNPLDKIGKYFTLGPVIVGGANINLAPTDVANGMTIVGGDLLTGTVVLSDLIERDLNTLSLTGGPFDALTNDFAFNEDLAYDGTNVWRAHFIVGGASGTIYQLNPALAGAVVVAYPQTFGPVGMTFVGPQLWTTDWINDTVGTFVAPNIYTAMFSTPEHSGCLAWDGSSGVLWVGQAGGAVIPYDLLGNPLGPAFFAFPPMIDTMDGCAIITTDQTEGCSSGFWKNDSKKWDANNWNTVVPSDSLETILGTDIVGPIKVRGATPGTADDPSVNGALNAKSGKMNALARELAAAVLNIDDGSQNYPMTLDELKALFAAVNQADDAEVEELRALLFDFNHAGCQLNHFLLA